MEEKRMPICPLCSMPMFYSQNWRGVQICNSCAAELRPYRRRKPKKELRRVG